MSELGFAVLFILSFAIGISWLALSVDARLGRSGQACQLPLPFDVLGYERFQKRHTGRRAVVVVAGGMLLFFAAVGAVVLGRLASMPPDTAAPVFHAYAWLPTVWQPIMAVGPIAFVISAALGMFCLGKGLDAIGR